MSKLKLYENVVIGNFLYGLGFAISAKSEATDFPSIVSLLQQNPMDQPLGDVLLEFSDGIVRLIEFKNKKSDHEKELGKYDNLLQDLQRMIIDEALKGMSERYQEISRSIHWFVETDPRENDFTSRIVPYLDAYPTGDSRCPDNSNWLNRCFGELMEQRLQQSTEQGFTSAFCIVDKLKEAQIQWELFLRDAPMGSQPGT